LPPRDFHLVHFSACDLEDYSVRFPEGAEIGEVSFWHGFTLCAMAQTSTKGK
jgi:hypothetical protein